MSDYFPNELIIEILTRLPVKSLLRFTTVCKSWHSLILSPSFITKHLNQTITNSKTNSDKLLVRVYDVQKERYLLCRDNEKFGEEYSELEFPFEMPFGYFRVVGSCNGLLCLSSDFFSDIPRIILWNPSVRKSVTLPMPFKPQGPYISILGFGANPMTHECKVVRIGYEMVQLDECKLPPKVELYTQGTGSWRGISSAAPSYCVINFMWSQAFVNGAVHWVAYDTVVVGSYHNLIMSFDMVTESFSEIMLPPTLANQHPTSLSVKLFGESLAVLCSGERDSGACCIWVMEEYGVPESWTKLFSTNLPGMLNKTSGFRKNGEVLLAMTNSLLSYAPGTKTLTSTGIRGSSHAFYVDPFMESLVLVEKINGETEGQLNPL